MKLVLMFALIISIIKCSFKSNKKVKDKTLKKNLFDSDKEYHSLRTLDDSTTIITKTTTLTIQTANITTTNVQATTVQNITDPTTIIGTTIILATIPITIVPSITTVPTTIIGATTNESNNLTDNYGLDDPIIIGFSKLKIENPYKTFYTYLRQVNSDDNPFIIIEVDVKEANKNLRTLEINETTINCTKEGNNKGNIYQYLCNTTISDSFSIDLKKIYINEVKENHKVKSIPFADLTKDLEFDKLDLFKEQITMYNCSIINDDNKIEIKGNIESSNINKKNPYLLVVEENHDYKNISCNFTEIDDNNRKLTCYPNDSFSAHLNMSIGSLDDEKNFILSFNEKDFVNYTNNPISNPKRNSKGLSAGAIVAIIIPCAVILIAIIIIGFLLGKKTFVVPPSPIQNVGNNTIGINSSSDNVK